MPETIALSLYALDELDPSAQARACDWFREGAFDYPWYEYVFDDFAAVCALLGVQLDTKAVPLLGGGTRAEPSIYFRGFSSQGDGACFEGHYRYRPGAARAIRTHAPRDVGLQKVVDALLAIQRPNFFQLQARIRHRGRYCHEYSMAIDVSRDSPFGQDSTSEAEEAVQESLRDLARWLYRRLEDEWDYLNSDDVVIEAIRSNGYRFTSNGRHYG